MKNKTISMPDDLFLKLSKCPNASGLISDLLYKHFQSPSEKTESLSQEIKEIEEEETKLAHKKEIKVQEIEIEVKKVELTEAEKQQEIERKKYLVQECIENCQIIFQVVISEEQAEEFLSGNWNNIREYLVEKNIF